MNLNGISVLSLFFSCAMGATPMIVTPGEMGSYKIEVDTQIDGVPRRFQLDTGANTSMVGSDPRSLVYVSEGRSTSRGASGTPLECDVIRPKIFELGELKVQAPKISRCDLGSKSFNNLGLDLLHDQIIELRFADSTLHFHELVPKDWTVEPLERLAKGHLKIDVKIAGQSYKAIFDTGAQLSSIDKAFVKANPTLFKAIPSQAPVLNIAGQPVPSDFYEMTGVKIGELDFTGLTVIAFEFGELANYLGADAPLILGTNAIVKAKWLLDLRGNQWGSAPL